MLPTIATGNVASATADAGYTVANSLRLDYGGSEYLTRTVSSAGSNTKSTLSAWVKRGNLSIAENTLFGWTTDGTNFYNIKFGTSSDVLDIRWRNDTTQAYYTATEVFRDTSAWYHIVVAVDTAQATDTNRIKYYINGVQGSGLSGYPPQNQTVMINNSDCVVRIADSGFSNGYIDGYVAEAVHVDGQQLDPTSFGEFDEDSPTIWKPKDVSGLTFGTNGFYLDFEDSADLGADVSGNSNDFTVNNLTSVDQTTDTPTNNFCTMNPLSNLYNGSYTYEDGNLVVQSDVRRGSYSTFGVASGKWYCEVKLISFTNSAYDNNNYGVGVAADTFNGNNSGVGAQASAVAYGGDGNKEVANSASSYGDTYTTNDIIGIALDLDNDKIYFSKNGTFQDSGDPTSGATGTGAIDIVAVGSTPDGAYFFNSGHIENIAKWSFNFGSPAYTISSGNADDNGYGNFEYDVPSGYYALCTKNLAEFG